MQIAQTIAPNVTRLNLLASNVYLVGEKGGPWVVVDSGMPGNFEKIRAAAEEIYGPNARPDALLLTHGHVDHYGSMLELSTFWDAPIYVHPLDLPYVTGKGALPPLDPTVGGFFAQIARFLPESATDVGPNVRTLPDDGTVPGMPGWQWLHTPGHTPGHVSLWRESDSTLLSADAVLTVNMDKAATMVSQKQEIYRPVTPGTYDWVAARKSMKLLAGLKPQTVASGHGTPMSGPEVAGQLESYAEDFIAPLHGRYVPQPARFSLAGVEYLPPPVPDALPTTLAFIGAGALLGAGVYGIVRKRSERRTKSEE